MDAQTIIGSIERVTRKWAKQRKAEERHESAKANRRRAMVRSNRTTAVDAAFQTMEEAYNAASDNGNYVANARQIMYAGRPLIQQLTQEMLNDKYFTQNLLPRYMRENPETTATWDVVFDARGHFSEPHTASEVQLGTLDVRRYLSELPVRDIPIYEPDQLYPTHGPQHRFGAILFIEKEGFSPLLEQVRIAERYDCAIMSTKGLSNTASRSLIDELCGKHDIPALVLHDFDKSGFSIFATLSTSSQRYSFQHEIRCVDIGVRLEDVETWGLQSELFYTKMSQKAVGENLMRNGATLDEALFIARDRKRVEVNAFKSADLVKFIEGKLEANGVKKLIPDKETLEAAYRRSLKNRFIQDRFDALKIEAEEYAHNARVRVRISKSKIAKLLADDPTKPWDIAVHELAAEHLRGESRE